MVILNRFILSLLCISLVRCSTPSEEQKSSEGLQLVVLGNAQDAGYPQTNCNKKCCQHYHSGKVEEKYPTSLGIMDHDLKQLWMFEATPAYRKQWRQLQEISGLNALSNPTGIFLSHAHIGHYTGLMQLGHEVMGAKEVPVFAMPRMKSFLETNGPWSQLVHFNNIQIQGMADRIANSVSKNLMVTPLKVPHRDEYSETVGFLITGTKATLLFIPDIDKWQKWDFDIRREIQAADYALLDGTFYGNGELPNRDMSEVPHPFIEESLKLFEGLNAEDKAKVHFIHFNHSNPIIWDKKRQKELESLGFNWAKQGQIFDL